VFIARRTRWFVPWYDLARRPLFQSCDSFGFGSCLELLANVSGLNPGRKKRSPRPRAPLASPLGASGDALPTSHTLSSPLFCSHHNLLHIRQW
jgi:hypothetical protein